MQLFLLDHLYTEYDPEFGQAEKMFKDLALSRDLVEEFHRKHNQNELYVNVLERGGWPFSLQRPKIDLPVEVSLSSTAGHTLIFFSIDAGAAEHVYHVL